MADVKSDQTTDHSTKLPERAEEARNLATEGLEEMKAGNKEEGDFLINEAKQLDQAAAQDVLKSAKK